MFDEVNARECPICQSDRDVIDGHRIITCERCLGHPEKLPDGCLQCQNKGKRSLPVCICMNKVHGSHGLEIG